MKPSADSDLPAGTFAGESRVPGKYTVDNGSFTYDAYTGRLNIAYDEVWSNGLRDSLAARVKSNAKFQCESSGGYEQKASNEAKNFPEDAEDRIGENALPGIKKYYTGDKEAAED